MVPVVQSTVPVVQSTVQQGYLAISSLKKIKKQGRILEFRGKNEGKRKKRKNGEKIGEKRQEKRGIVVIN